MLNDQTICELGRFSSGRLSLFLPVDSIRGLIHIVPFYTLVPFISKHVRMLKESDDFRKREDEWVSELVYVNRFCITRGGQYDFLD